ncbi:hypothetical protein JAAARDRAFT_581186 [Jaapia argillacea MUCL 33604]|uniref:Uncharacterized protein n=1 Tax=Jaapia argillacea MUCL 33604 TaxID=933084 RepID=A0A067P9W8_9AGAM|nr:hypothetical protein JAAARDRAFT_581186 [Jaapia argillacea MUCL 33604]
MLVRSLDMIRLILALFFQIGSSIATPATSDVLAPSATSSVPSTTGVTPSPSSTPSSSSSGSDPSQRNHDTAALAAAIVVSLFVLSVLTFSFSIPAIRRRRRAGLGRWQSMCVCCYGVDMEARGEEMKPPFVPRYFSGTEPNYPPPYSSPSSIHEEGETGFVTRRNEDEGEGLPSFGEAVGSPIPPLLSSRDYGRGVEMPETGSSVPPGLEHD